MLPAAKHMVGAIREQLLSAARRVDTFADELHELVPEDGSPAVGSAQGVALSLVGVCRTLARNWRDGAPISPDRLREYNRDLLFLQAMLDVPATRPPVGPPPPDRPLPLRGGGLICSARSRDKNSPEPDGLIVGSTRT